MATADISPEDRYTKDLDNANCPICLEVYRSPKCLPCLHTFCEACLEAYIVNLDEKSTLKDHFECPVCRKCTYSPVPGTQSSAWAGKFPFNYALLSIMDKNKDQGGQFCDPCREEGEKKNTEMFCSDCKEYLCTDCVVYHRKVKLTKGHLLMEKGSVSSDSSIPKKEVMFDAECNQHKGKQLEYFCKGHGALCCSTCAIVDHRKCNEITEIKTESCNIKSGKDYTEQNLKKMRDHVDNIMKSMQGCYDELQEKIEEIPSETKTLRQRMFKAMAEIEERVEKQRVAFQKEEEMYYRETKDRFARFAAAIDGSIMQLESVSKLGTESDIFITRHKLDEQIKVYGKMLEEQQSATRSRSIDVHLDSQLDLMLNDTEAMLKLDIKNAEQRLPSMSLLKTSDCQVELVEEISLGTPGVLPLYSGAACLENGMLVLADTNNKQICVFDEKFTFKNKLKFESRVWKVVAVNDNIVAVPFRDKRLIQLIEIGERTIEPKHSISTEDVFLCLIKTNTGFAGTTDQGTRSRFVVLDENGKEERSFDRDNDGREFGEIRHIATDLCKTRLYHTCAATGALYCFGLSGEPFFTYTNEGLVSPAGVDIDNDDNVYVCGNESRNIHQLTPEGKLIRIINTRFCQPLNLCFLRGVAEFVVSNSREGSRKRDKLLRFKLI